MAKNRAVEIIDGQMIYYDKKGSNYQAVGSKDLPTCPHPDAPNTTRLFAMAM